MSLNKKFLSEKFVELGNLISHQKISKNYLLRQFKSFSDAKLGSVMIFKTAYKKYDDILTYLVNECGKQGDISRKYLDSLLRYSVLLFLDINKQDRKKTKLEKIKNSIIFLNEKINIPPKKFDLIYPVMGVRHDGLPFTFGAFELFVFSPKIYNEIGLRLHSTDDEKRKEFIISERRHVNEFARNKVFAKIQVTARDEYSARSIGFSTLQRQVSILNFFISMAKYNFGCIYFPGEANQENIFSPLIEQDFPDRFNFSYSGAGTLTDTSVLILQDNDFCKTTGLNTIQNILKEPKSEIHSLILDSIYWAGKASFEKLTGNSINSFLFYTIALEILLLPKMNSELIYRFCLNLAALIGNSRDNKIIIAENAKNLYCIRSDIVHEGLTKIDPNKLNELECFTRRAIVKFINKNLVFSLSKYDDLNRWYGKNL